MRIMRSILFAVLVSFALLPAAAAQGSGVLWLTADGAVTPAMSVYIQRGLRAAQTRGAQLVVVQLNTPGGEVTIMEDIVRAIRASPVPVVVYVAPRGAIAGSAGTVITLAGHVAAMAPETAIGAASPVGPQGEDLQETLQAKTKEILKAMARSLAEGRPPQAIELIESTIEEARAVTAAEALQSGMIDIVAADRADLLRQLDGMQVNTAAGGFTLQTSVAAVEEFPLTLTEQLLQLLTNPNIVFLLLAVGAQAVLIELAELRHRLLNDATTDAHAAHQPPVTMDLAVLLARRVAQVHAAYQSRRQRKRKHPRSALHARIGLRSYSSA